MEEKTLEKLILSMTSICEMMKQYLKNYQELAEDFRSAKNEIRINLSHDIEQAFFRFRNKLILEQDASRNGWKEIDKGGAVPPKGKCVLVVISQPDKHLGKLDSVRIGVRIDKNLWHDESGENLLSKKESVTAWQFFPDFPGTRVANHDDNKFLKTYKMPPLDEVKE